MSNQSGFKILILARFLFFCIIDSIKGKYMYKYTPCQEVLRKYASISQNAKRPWDDHYFLAKSIAGSAEAYFSSGDFWANYTGTCFYSHIKRKQVPVNGVLVNACWFQESKV